MGTPLDAFFTTIQNAVTAVNNLGQLINGATLNSSSLQVTINSTIFGSGSVKTVNTGVGLTGGPITNSGTLAVSLSTLTNSLTSSVTVSSIATAYVDGPTVAQGSSGVWLATGAVTVTDTSGSHNFFCKLWDGTTVIDSGNVVNGGAGFRTMAALSGVITNPSGNIKISVNCPDISTTASIDANRTGNAKDSTITVVRIG